MSESNAMLAQRALSAAHRCDPSVCPDEDTLIAFAEGRVDSARRDQVAASVAACAVCAAAVRATLDASTWAHAAAADFDRPKPSVPASEPRMLRRPRGTTWLPLALAASLTVIVGAGWLLRAPPIDEGLRGSAAVATTPADGAVLDRAPVRLAWPCDAAPGAAQVELLASDATPRWAGAATGCAVTLPSQARDALQPGEYLWRVRNAAGQTLLGPVAFRISP